MTTEADVRELPALEATDIQPDFVPVRREAVSAKELDDELVLINGQDGSIHVLNATGSVIWNCFDGRGTLATIIDDIAEAFGAPREHIEEDVLGITRWIGEAGLLEGVVRTEREDTTPAGFEVGQEVTPFTLPALDGPPIDLRDLRGSRVLLVNWSPFCSFCERVAPELALMQPALKSQGVRLVFLSTGTAKENRKLLVASELQTDVLLPPEAPAADFEDPFPGMGTPAAYLLDEEGKVAAPLAYGANEVPVLAGQAAALLPITSAPSEGVRAPAGETPHGADEDASAEEGGGPKYLPASSGVCAPGATSANKKPRAWSATAAYAVGEYHVGIRADSPATDDLLARVFADLRLPEGTRAPDNYSVVLEGAARGTRGLSLLLEADSTVVRSRTPRRVIMALAARLSALVAPPDDLLRTTDVAALIGGEVILLPDATVAWLEQTQGRLARIGIRLSDEPYSAIDTERLELVVPEPLIAFDQAALEDLRAPFSGRSELPPIEPGRYPLRAWAIDFDAEDMHLTRPQAISVAWGGLRGGQGDSADMVDRLADLFSRLDVVPLPFEEPDELVNAVQERLVAAS